MRVFLVGPPGAGKSIVGRHLAAHLQATFFDLDEVIQERAGADIPWIFDVEGESGFRDRESAVVKDFASRDNVVIATGGGVVLRPENRIVMSNASTVVYLEASLSTLVSRTEGKTKRPLLVGKDVRKVLQEIMAVREPLYREVADVTVTSTGGSAKKLAGVIAEKLTAFKKGEP
ncbi:MAG: shikimate kinase [Pseudomonadota bacterium]|nr:shikimate kinase [Pseudomonadota bacterium]